MDILIPADRIARRVGELALRIQDDYNGQPVTVVGVLTGCLLFLADLIRRVNLPLRVVLLQASSYRGTATTSGELRLTIDPSLDVKGKNLLVLDDILDTGKTLAQLTERLREAGASQIRTAVLLRKLGRQIVTFEPDYVGFEIPDVFVVGYGLDYNDHYRHLPFIAALTDADIQSPP
jgi:hypoxanthine phosphoribosyltransferase